MDNTYLTANDLNDFKLEIITSFDRLNNLKEEIYNAKINKKIDVVKIKSKEYKILRKDYLIFCKQSKFHTNFKHAKKSFRKDYITKDELSFAKNIYKESRLTVKEHGAGASLSQLNDVALKIVDLSFRYSTDLPHALKNVSLEINHGEYVTIIGHNGSGKSTLSKILIGVLSFEDGELTVFGNTVNKNNISQIRKFLGIVFQNPDNQFIGSTVEADIAFGLENKRVEPAKMKDIIVNAATRVGMEKHLDKEPLNLSGGQKQRVAIASALALDPKILIFDEATSMLDPKGKREIKEIMVDLREKGDKTIISITHDMDEILNADKVIVMEQGRIVKIGTPLEVTSNREFLRKLSLDVPFVSGIEEALQNEGFKIEGSKNMDELVDELCK